MDEQRIQPGVKKKGIPNCKQHIFKNRQNNNGNYLGRYEKIANLRLRSSYEFRENFEKDGASKK